MMNALDRTHTVREFAVEIPGSTRLFERFGIDYCCGGGKSLEQACAEKGLDVDQFVATLEVLGEAAKPASDVAALPLGDLVDHIVGTHHAFARGELDRLDRLFEKVCAAHGERHPALFEVRRVFYALGQELLPHMEKEERVLFPYVKELAQAAIERRQPPAPFFGTVRNPIRMMSMEHDTAGELLARMRETAGNYELPEGACMTFRALYEGLAELERDTHEHIHEENNILFPRAIELESQ